MVPKVKIVPLSLTLCYKKLICTNLANAVILSPVYFFVEEQQDHEEFTLLRKEKLEREELQEWEMKLKEMEEEQKCKKELKKSKKG